MEEMERIEDILSMDDDIMKESSAFDDGTKSQVITIADKLTEKHIKLIKTKLEESLDRSIPKHEFQLLLEDVTSTIFPSEDDYNLVFKKMDSKRDDRIDWDEFISFIILEFQLKELFTSTLTKQLLEPPISGHPKFLRSHHRHPIVRITFCPTVNNDRQMNYHSGKYMTASKDGCINYWSLDMGHERTAYSICPELKVNPTWVTDMVCMPDVNVVCTSATERDLRFYDTTAKKFELRVMISSLENAACCMHYHFSTNIQEDSKLIIGDMGGSILVLLFNSANKGPFAQKPGADVKHLRYEHVAKGHLKGLKVVSFLNVHSAWVSQVAYYPVLKSFISCCPTAENSMIICDIAQTRNPYKFNIPSHGASCFTFEEDIHMVVTGGSDSLIRIWNPFVPAKASSTLKGHHAAVCSIIIQKENSMLYTLSKDRCIKVWNYSTQSCIQTFTGLLTYMGHHKVPIQTFYNPETHAFMIASTKIALITCEKVINEIYSDGYTHTKAVTKAMYNPLFRCLISIGMDSSIMTWDIILGKRISLIKKAHTQMQYGEIHEVEITAGTFDPSFTLLLTGARDGTLKIWNFHNGTCIRNMFIERNCLVTNVMWIPSRILAVGWNRHVTEFADNVNVGDGKYWEKRHTEDILASCVRPPQALVTSSCNGELVFWRLETGQPYKKFTVYDPGKKHQIDYKSSKPKEKKDSLRISSKMTSIRRFSTIKASNIKLDTPTKGLSRERTLTNTSIANQSGESYVSLGDKASQGGSEDDGTSTYGGTDNAEETAIHSTLFLCERPMDPDWGSLLVSLESGFIQIWSHHKLAGLINSFDARYTPDDYIITMATDPENKYLFTGDTNGYLRVWLMTNYGVPHDKMTEINIPQLRKTFSYFARKQSHTEEPTSFPLLLSSYQGHTRTVTHIEYLHFMKVIVSCSVDRTVRFWTLQGQYVGTLGSNRQWPKMFLNQAPELQEYRIPPDIKRIASETTLKVIGFNPRERHRSIVGTLEQSLHEEERDIVPAHEIHGSPVEDPILGNYFKLPSRGKRIAAKPTIDISVGPSIQVFTHMRTHATSEVQDIIPPSSLAKAIKAKALKQQVTSQSNDLRSSNPQLSQRSSLSNQNKKSSEEKISSVMLGAPGDSTNKQ